MKSHRKAVNLGFDVQILSRGNSVQHSYPATTLQGGTLQLDIFEPNEGWF
ncbi:MAG: hypothetical protein JXR34_11010 [Bacteroidales bacterium]|nr:hypothetical protein [Bacteroidales bacterium]